MSQDMLVAAGIVVPILAMLFLRINGAMVFLSLCLGAVLVDSVGAQANEMARLFVPSAGNLSESTIKLILLLAPAVVTAVLTVFSVHGRLKVLLNAVPGAAAAMLAVLLAGPLLPPELKDSLGSPTAWHLLSKSEALVVGVGAVMCLSFLWTQRRSFSHQDKRHK